METKEIVNWLRDKACRADSPSWTRMMHTAADQLMRLEHRLQQSNAERDAVTKRMIELEQMVGKTTSVITKADRLRTMSDEELGRHLMNIHDSGCFISFCKNKPECEELLDNDSITDEMCMECMMQWLKQPAEVNNA